MDIGRAFNAPFKDKQWIGKAALGGLLFLVPILQWVVYGALVKYIQRVTTNNDELPEWGDDFGDMFTKGFFVFLAGLIFSLPAIILFTIAFLPLIGAAIAGAGSNSNSAGALLSAGGGFACLLSLVAFAYIIFISIYFYAAVAHYAMKGSFGAFFEFGEVMGKIRTPGAGFWTAWLMGIVLVWAAGLVGGIVSSILSIIPVLGSLAGFYLTYVVMYLAIMMVGSLFGQYAQTAYGIQPAVAYMPPTAPPPAPGGYQQPTASPAPPAPSAPTVAPPAAPTAPAAPAAPSAAPPASPAPSTPPTSPAPPAPPAEQ